MVEEALKHTSMGKHIFTKCPFVTFWAIQISFCINICLIYSMFYMQVSWCAHSKQLLYCSMVFCLLILCSLLVCNDVFYVFCFLYIISYLIKFIKFSCSSIRNLFIILISLLPRFWLSFL